MNDIKIGPVAGLTLIVTPSALFGTILLWALIIAVAALLLDLPLLEALVGGLVAVLLHWTAYIVHQLGHAWAARRTGYPMFGVRFVWLLGADLYPRDEPALPAAIHVRRALGGPAASLLLSLVAALFALLLRPLDQTPGWIAAFFLLENLLVFTLGAFVPSNLMETDGGTLLKWWRQR